MQAWHRMWSFVSGLAVGTLGGLIGLGGAEFRLPLLISFFRFAALEAVILNKAMSLVVVATALPFRASTVPFSEIALHWSTVVNLLAGSLIGAWVGASWATRLSSRTLYRTIAVLLVMMATVLLWGHDLDGGQAWFTGAAQIAIGVIAGFAIGVVAALMGVAGGELLIPTLMLLFGADIKLAGSLSLAVSLPTMLAGFARYSRDRSFSVIVSHWPFALIMGRGINRGSVCRRPLAGRRAERNSNAGPGRDPDRLRYQGVAALIHSAPLTRRVKSQARRDARLALTVLSQIWRSRHTATMSRL